nr:hypothetical protein [Tanacetum cinerariifolium]
MDVKTEFLNGPLIEKVFVRQPDGFVDLDFSNHVYRFKKALYGLKQAPRAWFINHPEESLYVNQYTLDLLKKHGMAKYDTVCTPMATTKLDADLQGTQVDQTKYRSIIGGLMYLTASRPNIVFATFICARYQAHPAEKHLKEVKRIFRYLRQTINMGLWYWKDSRFELIAYSDADLVGCNDDCKSTSGGIQFLRDKLVSWSSKKQDCTSMSTTKAEYEHVEKGTIELYFVGTEYQLADLFTKALSKERFEYLVHRIEDYHSIKDDTPLVGVYTTGDVRVRGMLILAAFLTEEIHATNDFKEYEMVFMTVDVPMNQPQPVVSTQGTQPVFKERISLQDRANDPTLQKASKGLKSARGSSSKHSAKNSTNYVSNQQQQKEWDAWVEEIVTDEVRALHPKWRVKFTAIEESKDLTSLSLYELTGNLKIYEMIIKKDSEIVKAKGERKSLALKDKKESSNEESLTSRSEDEEYALAVRDFKKFFKRRGRECAKLSRDKNQRAFVRGSWSDSVEEDDEKAKDKTCLMTQASSK